MGITSALRRKSDPSELTPPSQRDWEVFELKQQLADSEQRRADVERRLDQVIDLFSLHASHIHARRQVEAE